MKFCDSSFDITPGYAKMGKSWSPKLFFIDFVVTWEHYWIIFGYTGGRLDNIGCCFRHFLNAKTSLNDN